MKKFSLLKKIILSKKNFLPPKKNNIMILDDIFSDIFKENFKKVKFGIIDVRLKRINFFILLKLFFSNKKMVFFNYVIEYIKHTNCKILITFNDNLVWYYQIKKFFPEIKIISVQNGFRNKFFFKELSDNKSLKADIIFVFNNQIGNLYKKHIKTKTFPLGSFKNNFTKINNKNKKRNSILFVSSNYPRTKYYESTKNYYKFRSSDFYKPDVKLFKNLFLYCKSKDLKLEVIGKSAHDRNEYEYYVNLIGSDDFLYHYKKKAGDTTIYNISDDVLATVCTHSTFGSECLARGNKTAIFNNKCKSSNGIFDIFWYTKMKKKGEFWSNTCDFKEVNRVMNFVINSKHGTWKKKTFKYIDNLMAFNERNKKLNTFLK